jgi:hypothetical protein
MAAPTQKTVFLKLFIPCEADMDIHNTKIAGFLQRAADFIDKPIPSIVLSGMMGSSVGGLVANAYNKPVNEKLKERFDKESVSGKEFVAKNAPGTVYLGSEADAEKHNFDPLRKFFNRKAFREENNTPYTFEDSGTTYIANNRPTINRFLAAHEIGHQLEKKTRTPLQTLQFELGWKPSVERRAWDSAEQIVGKGVRNSPERILAEQTYANKELAQNVGMGVAAGTTALALLENLLKRISVSRVV